MKFEFITTLNEIKNVIIYSKEISLDKIYETRMSSQINVSYSPAHAEGKDIPVALSPYISQLGIFLDDNEDRSRPFIATMRREMLECYSLLANCRYLKIKEMMHVNGTSTFISEITVDNIIYPEEIVDKDKWISTCVDSAFNSNSKYSSISNIIIVHRHDNSLTFRIELNDTAHPIPLRSLGLFVSKVLITMSKHLTKEIVIYCDKCYSEISRVSIPITYSEKAVSDFQIDNIVQYVKCCENGKLIKTDSGMYDMIRKLNSSSIRTTASCESHPFKDYDMYIAFDASRIPLSYLTNVINRMRYEKASSFMKEFEAFFEFDSKSSQYNYCVRIRRDAYITVIGKDGFLEAKRKMLKMPDTFCNELVNFFK